MNNETRCACGGAVRVLQGLKYDVEQRNYKPAYIAVCICCGKKGVPMWDRKEALRIFSEAVKQE